MNIYFCGIGGAGLMPLAQLCKDCGWQVTGSDGVESLNTKILKEQGFVFTNEQTGEFLKDFHQKNGVDWFVYSSAIKEENPEFQMAKKLGLKMQKRDGILNLILQEKNLKMLAVAGTHGKTTTTGMLVWLFKSLKKEIAYSVGSNISFGKSAEYQAGSQYFVYECDEFDRNFLNFLPQISCVTSLDYDHVDTYEQEEDYFQAFGQFLNNHAKSSFLWAEDVEKLKNFKVFLNKNNEILSFDAEKNNLEKIQILGQHNRKNAFLAIKIFLKIYPDFDLQTLIKVINNFPGTQRRQEKLAKNIYSDYAHHPKEIASTIQLFSELKKPITLVYQPHQNIRQHHIKDDYKHCFSGIKKLYWLPTFLSREDGQEILKPEFLMAKVEGNFEKNLAQKDENLAKNLQQDLKNGNIVVFMGAGDIDAWARENFKK